MPAWPGPRTCPVAVGESLYSLSQFNEYLARGATSIVQVDVARIGGITPLAEGGRAGGGAMACRSRHTS